MLEVRVPPSLVLFLDGSVTALSCRGRWAAPQREKPIEKGDPRGPFIASEHWSYRWPIGKTSRSSLILEQLADLLDQALRIWPIRELANLVDQVFRIRPILEFVDRIDESLGIRTTSELANLIDESPLRHEHMFDHLARMIGHSFESANCVDRREAPSSIGRDRVLRDYGPGPFRPDLLRMICDTWWWSSVRDFERSLIPRLRRGCKGGGR